MRCNWGFAYPLRQISTVRSNWPSAAMHHASQPLVRSSSDQVNEKSLSLFLKFGFLTPMYRIASNKHWGRSFNFWHILGGVYSREEFTRRRHLLQNTEKVTYIKVNDFVVFSYPKNGIILFVNHIMHPFLYLCRE